MKLLIATKNKAKSADIRVFITKLAPHIELVDLLDINITGSAPETGTNYKENSKEKALFYGNLSGLPTIADDSGFEIEYFNNAPGYLSRLWPSGGVKENTDEEIIEFMRVKIQEIPKDKCAARFVCGITFYNPLTKITHYAEEYSTGHIVDEENPHKTLGYPYRVFYKNGLYNKYYEELTTKEKYIVSHRRKAVEAILISIQK
jgi:XTP/dITP diphosphohydrolase